MLKISTLFNKENSFIWIIIAVGLIMKLSIANYGLPYLFHPDEPYIFKDPFKILYNYSHFDFSSSTNLLFWIILFWFAIFYIIKLFSGNITDFSEFQTLLISEDPSVILTGRMLSILLSLVGTLFILLIIKRITKDPVLKLLLGFIIVLNPIEIISNLWLKFDPAAYCVFSILFFLTYKFFYENAFYLRKKILLISFLAISLRIDLIAFFVLFLLVDLKRFVAKYSFKEYIRKTWKVLVFGVICYGLFTFLPVVYVYSHYFQQNSINSLPIVQTFFSAIISKIFQGSIITNLWQTFSENIAFYFCNSTFVSLGPIAILLFLVYLKKQFQSYFTKFFLVILAFLLVPILLFPFHAPHYFLLLSVIILVFGIIGITEIKNKKVKYLFSIIHLVYIGSITVQMIYYIICFEDTRLTARNYILQITSENDLIAIEGYKNVGLVPPVDECSEVLLEKARIIQKYNLGTGETFKIKAQQVKEKNCRKILEVSTPIQYENTEFENIWNIDFDPVLLLHHSPKYYISTNNYVTYRSVDKFSNTIKDLFYLHSVFFQSFIDPRIDLVFQDENFFPTLYFYKRKFVK